MVPNGILRAVSGRIGGSTDHGGADTWRARSRPNCRTPRRCSTGPPTTTSSTRSTWPTRTASGTSSRERCPMAHTDRWGGSWLPTRYDDVNAIAHDIETFPSGNGISVVPIVDRRRSATTVDAGPGAHRRRPADQRRPAAAHVDASAGAADDEPCPCRRVRDLHPRAVPPARRRDPRAGARATPRPTTRSRSRCA